MKTCHFLTILLLLSAPVWGADLHVLSIGIEPDMTRKEEFDLYSNDALLVNQAFSSRAPSSYRIKNKLLNGKHATRENVLAQLKKIVSEAGSKDVTIVFFSCHGDIEKNKGYYFTLAPKNGNEKASYLYASEFHKALENLQGKLIVIADTCRAEGLLPKDSKTKASFLLASKAEESSYGQEFDTKRPHGYFVNALCEALAGAADFNNSKSVTLEELQSYMDERSHSLCQEQTAVSKVQSKHRSTKLSGIRNNSLSSSKGKIRNPFGCADVVLKNEKELNELLKDLTLKIKGDLNEKDWTKRVVQGNPRSIEGEWAGRWREGKGSWSSGVAWIKESRGKTYLMFNGDSSEYLMELKSLGKNRYGGHYMSLSDPSDTGAWAGVQVSLSRVDGFFQGGRWDFRRKLK